MLEGDPNKICRDRSQSRERSNKKLSVRAQYLTAVREVEESSGVINIYIYIYIYISHVASIPIHLKEDMFRTVVTKDKR